MIVNADNTTEALKLYWSTILHGVEGTHMGLDRIYQTITQFDGGGYVVGVDDLIYKKVSSSSLTGVAINTAGGGVHLKVDPNDRSVHGFIITLTCPSLYKVDKKEGYQDTSVVINIFYKKISDTLWTPLLVSGTADYTISAPASRSELLRTIESPILDFAAYEVYIVRVTPSHEGDLYYADTIFVKEISSIINKNIAYNHTAMLGLKIRATDQLSGQAPTVTSIVKGLKISVPNIVGGTWDATLARWNTTWNANKGKYELIGDWDGSMSDGSIEKPKRWCDNPVWCLYDLITNSRYGLADYYKIDPDKAGMMRANFFIMAQYCDEIISYKDELGATKTRKRFTLNLVLDQSKAAAEWVSTIAATMRATLYYSEGIFWVDIDRPKVMSQLFNMANIKEYSQAGTSFKAIPNCYEVQYINPLAGYEIDVFKVESKELQLDQHLEERKKALVMIGVTNYDQAKALAKYALVCGQYLSKVISFKTGTDALRCTVGDVIGIQHDVPLREFGGKVTGYDPLTGYISLSTPVTLYERDADSQLVDWAIHLTQADVADPIKFNVKPIVNGSIHYGDATTTVVSTDLTKIPAKGDLFSLALVKIVNGKTYTVSQYRITSIKRDADDMCEVNAVQYDPQIYTMADDTSDMAVFHTVNYSLLTNPSRVSVQGVHAIDKIYTDAGGTFRVGAEIFYSIPYSNINGIPQGQSFWKGAKLHYKLDNASSYTTLPEISDTGYFFVPNIPVTGMYRFVVTSVYTTGQQAIEDALGDSVKHPWDDHYISIYVPNDTFLEGVNGLCIVNKANDGTFEGRDCCIEWRKPVTADAAVNSVVTLSAGSPSNDSWFKDYTIIVKNFSDGSIRRTTHASTERYTYTHEMNHQDGAGTPTRKFIIEVFANDRVGRTSAGKSIICANPAPAAIV
jgi:hypothetical protein